MSKAIHENQREANTVVTNTSLRLMLASPLSRSTDNGLCVRKALEMYHSMILPAEDP